MELGYLIHNLDIDGKVVLRWLDEEDDDQRDVWYFGTETIHHDLFRAEVVSLYAIHPIDGDIATCIEVKM